LLLPKPSKNCYYSKMDEQATQQLTDQNNAASENAAEQNVEQPPVETVQEPSTETSKTDETSTPTRNRFSQKKDEFRWYVAHTYSGHEKKVEINLKKRLQSFGIESMVQEIFIPTQDKIEVKEGKRREVSERMFPGYVLVKMMLNDETFSAVRGTPGVTSFVGIQNQVTPLADKQVDAIKLFTEQGAPQYEAQFSLGEGVKIIDGPFTDFVGTVEEIDEAKGKIKVLVSIFGRETPVELDFLQVGKL